jgi:LPXTG-site transpeptidase (sortase) family protein
MSNHIDQIDTLGVECALPAGYTRTQAPDRTPRWVRPRIATALLVTGLAAGIWQLGEGFYIHAKAQFAQHLNADAWTKILAGQRAVKPWPWTDTWPVAAMQGDPLTVQQEDGVIRHYRVSNMKVVDKYDTRVASAIGPTRLTLITCWPFDAMQPSGRERYVVSA